MLKTGHNNQLRITINGEYSDVIKNNNGVFQGSSLGAYLLYMRIV